MYRYLVLLLVILACTGSVQAQCDSSAEESCIYLIRHAEKADDGTSDPPLSKEGTERALHLKEIMQSTNISAIYSTDLKRTRDTVAPLASATGVTIQIYDYRSLNQFASMVLDDHAGESVVISGHSNTTPFLVNYFMQNTTLRTLDESQYGDIFIVKISKDGERELIRSEF